MLHILHCEDTGKVVDFKLPAIVVLRKWEFFAFWYSKYNRFALPLHILKEEIKKIKIIENLLYCQKK